MSSHKSLWGEVQKLSYHKSLQGEVQELSLSPFQYLWHVHMNSSAVQVCRCHQGSRDRPGPGRGVVKRDWRAAACPLHTILESYMGQSLILQLLHPSHKYRTDSIPYLPCNYLFTIHRTLLYKYSTELSAFQNTQCCGHRWNLCRSFKGKWLRFLTLVLTCKLFRLHLPFTSYPKPSSGQILHVR